MQETSPAAILEVEAFALAHAQDLGRGIVVLSIDGSLAQMVFVPLASWQADPLPCYADDPNIKRWLAEYDPRRQYVLIQGIRDGDLMNMRPFCLPYVLIDPTRPLAVAA